MTEAQFFFLGGREGRGEEGGKTGSGEEAKNQAKWFFV